jgi:hypothetical protein
MTITRDDLRDLIAEVMRQEAPAEDVMEKYVSAFANSFDPPLSAMTVYRWRDADIIPGPTCTILGIPYIRRSARLAALEELEKRRDVKESNNPAANLRAKARPQCA